MTQTEVIEPLIIRFKVLDNQSHRKKKKKTYFGNDKIIASDSANKVTVLLSKSAKEFNNNLSFDPFQVFSNFFFFF